MSSFRASKFDPVLLSAQIVALQCTYYLTASLLIFLLELLTGSPITLAHVLSSSELRTDTVLGWALSLGMLLNALAAAYALVIIVGRSRLCVDFSVTLHVLHLLATAVYSRGVPRSVWWWVVVLTSMVGVAVGGEKLCLRKEMEPIELVGAKKRHASVAAVHSGRNNTASGSGGNGDHDDDDDNAGAAGARGSGGTSVELQRLTQVDVDVP
ncbi:hypothetical protein HDU87_005525 [Geranomyces variabilis]|uniref:Protein SYS1 n=1 Tax=Geranomyces variabilis TaxID=109894 RepID=A0AAD5TGT6_9FUNG|nr:hypothetical protein HDU87_005525 [Geranomyces variabilis]